MKFLFQIDGEYEIIFEKIEQAAKDDKIGDFNGLRVKKFNRTTLVYKGLIKKYILKCMLLFFIQLCYQWKCPIKNRSW